MIASLSKPTVSLVIGDSHSIGVPLAVASDYSFIVPTGTMLVHPVRMSGMVIGTAQTYEYFEMIAGPVPFHLCVGTDSAFAEITAAASGELQSYTTGWPRFSCMNSGNSKNFQKHSSVS